MSDLPHLPTPTTPASLATAMASALARALPTVPAADAVEALWELLAAADAVATQEARQ
jgi:hypothetical protein